MKKLIYCILIFVLIFVLIFTGCAKNSPVPAEPESTFNEQSQEEQIPGVTSMPLEGTPAPAKKNTLDGKVIVVDAGHGINSSTKQEKIAPNTSKTKRAFVSGASGKNQTEEQLNLSVALKLEAKLKKMGADVYMTRTEHKTDMSNIDRAEFANNLNADISVKIHADGSDNSRSNGVSVLVPGSQYISDDNLINESNKAADCILQEFVKATNAKNRGISIRNDLTGFNWSKIPIVLVEIGFMSNPEEDALMETENYQNKMVDGIAKGLDKYFNN